MIIPPDPEKDPNIFSASSSQPSFLLSASGSVSSIRHPEASHGNPAFGYPFLDDLGFGSMGEALPPYEGRRVRRRPLSGGEGRGDSIDDSSRQPTIDIPPRPRRLSASSSINPQASLSETSSSHNPPIIASSQGSSITLIAPSNSKEWESSSLPQTAHRRRFLSIPLPILSSLPIPPRARKWWKQYRRYVHAVLVLLLIGIGLMIGLLVGLRRALLNRPPQGGSQQSRDSDGDGRRTTSWNITSGSSLNITYVASRDGPSPSDGVMTQCNLFTTLDASNVFSLLSTPFPASSLSLATFTFPLTNSSTLPFALANTSSFIGDFAITATGLGASGTVEIVGSDAPEQVASGTEGMLQVDVVVRYSGDLDLDHIMRVCRTSRSDGSMGVGIYTPTETDGKVTNPYMINPLLLPSFDVVIRLPPSALNSTRSSIYLPSATFTLDRMGVRFGDLQNMVDFGNITVTSGRGGLVAEYVAAENVNVTTSQNSVRGLWNISESIFLNATGGSIISDIILHDPTPAGNASVQNITLLSPPPVVDKRDPKSRSIRSANPASNRLGKVAARRSTGPSSRRLPNPLSALFSASEVRPTHSVSTSFSTTQGLISVSYLQQPPRTALSSLITNGGGEVEVSMHPNYVGPFVLKDTWGDVRLPFPSSSRQIDPLRLNRTRLITLGDVNMLDGSLFSDAGLNGTFLGYSGSLITGAAYWNGTGFAPQSARDVQAGDEGSGSGLLVLGSWGDVRVTFDGT